MVTVLSIKLTLDPVEQLQGLLQVADCLLSLEHTAGFQVEDFVGKVVETQGKVKLEWNAVWMASNKFNCQVLALLVVTLLEVGFGEVHLYF